MSNFDYTYFKKERKNPRIKTFEEFITHSSKVHNGKYDYSQSLYVKNQSKIKIGCPIHGIFEQVAQNHINGSGCPKCGKLSKLKSIRLSGDEFVRRSNIVHDNKYTYPNHGFKGINYNVKIVCPDHGEFTKRASVHMSGIGCKECSRLKSNSSIGGFKRSAYVKSCEKYGGSSNIYLIRCFSMDEHFFKIGITSRSIESRFPSVQSLPYKYEVLIISSGNSAKIWDLESKIHKSLRRYKYKPRVRFDGNGECFLCSEHTIREKLLNSIDNTCLKDDF